MNILVLAGGTSTERDVSLVTGSKIYKALLEKEHNVILADVYYGISDELVGDNIVDLFSIEKDWAENIVSVKERNPDLNEIINNRPSSADGYFGPHIIEAAKVADIVFLALHGENGENGKIQATFDLLGVKYTGTGYLSSALAMDKILSKGIFTSNGVPTPEFFVVKDKDNVKKPSLYPVVVKTACGGSSVGVYIVNDESEYSTCVKEALSYGSDVIVEQYIKGREFSVGVVDGSAYPVIEIAPITGFYDYKNKYQEGSTIETCPAELSKECTEKMQEIAVKAYTVLGMESYGRMDFMMDDKENIYCLEANTLPGMTPTSLLPQEAGAIGESFPDLCEKLIKVSLKKYN